MTTQQLGVWLPAGFTAQHQRVVLKHLLEGRWTLSRAEWRWALEGFGLLHNAFAKTSFGWQKFNAIYSTQVETAFANRYLTDLLALNNVEAQSTALWARYPPRGGEAHCSNDFRFMGRSGVG